jgi:hypothetical protein
MNAIQKIAHQMSRVLVAAGVSVLAFAATTPAHATSVYCPAPSCFSGAWITSCGTMVLKQSGSYVCGPYGTYGGCVGGYVAGNCFRGEWQVGCDRGYCEFTKTGNGRGFTGYWKYPNGSYGGAWNGTLCQPSFQASWCTNYGPVKLFVDGSNNVFGQFNYSASAGGYLGRIDGKVSGNVMLGTWQSGSSRGTCKFVLASDGAYFVGAWGDVYGNYQGDWCGDYEGAIYQ